MRLILDRILGVCFAIAFLQFPLFISEYQHQLIGHVAELKWQTEAMQVTAAKTGKTLDDYIQKFITQPDPDFSEQGKVMKNVHRRFLKLTSALKALQQSIPITRPWAFIRYFQIDIAKSTLQAFTPGIPLNLEGLLYGFAGILISLFFVRIVKMLAVKILRPAK